MRQLARSYLQHGTRHAPTGSDPIPGVGGVSMIMANGSGGGLTGGGNYIDMTAYITSDASIYTLELGTGGLSSTHGVAIHQEGIYRAWFQFRFTSGVNGDTLAGSYDGAAGPDLLWLASNTQNDNETRVVYSSVAPAVRKVQFARLFVVGGSLEPLPVAALPRLVFAQTANETGGGGGSYNVGAWILVERLGSSYTTNSFVPF